jgi:tetratricopeptide (TPR) repeat protein
MGPDDVRRLINEAENAPYGAGRIALAEEAIRHADALDDRRLRFDARMAGTGAYQMGGEPAKAFVTFSWCLAEYDRDPAGFGPWDDELLRWHFKWVVSGLRKFPEVPLERTYAVLDDMERRYRLGGHSMHAVYMLRWRLAHHIGDAETAERWYVRWCAAPRDQNSDCRGCDPTAKVEHLASRGRDEEAIALAEPVLAGRLTCAEQPHAMLTELLLPYLRTGRLDQARDAHLRGYRGVRRNLADLGEIGQHVEFCALTGNEVRGLEILERHLDWLDRAPSPYAAMNFASSAAFVLRRLAASGRGDLAVRRGTGEVGVAALADELTATARDLANRFDARNGTGHQGALVEARLAALPLVDLLPLSAVDRAAARPVAPPPPEPKAAAYPDDPAELLDLVERLHRLRRVSDAAAAWRHAEERHAARSLPPALAARRFDVQGQLAGGGRGDVAEASWREALDGYAAAGDETGRLAVQGRLGVLLCDNGRAEEGLPLVEESARLLADHPDLDRRIAAHLRLGHVYLIVDRLDEALASIDRAAAEVAGSPDPLPVAEVEVHRAKLLIALERPEEALAASIAARERYADAGDPPAAGLAHLMSGYAVVTGGGDAADAVGAFMAALCASEDADVVLAAHQGAGQALLASGRAAQAVGHLVEAVAGFVAGGHDVPAAFTRYDLARAYHQAQQPTEAAEAAEEALTALDRLGAQDAADRCRYLLSRVYRDIDAPELALAQLDRLVVNLDGFDNLPVRGQMHEETAQLLYQADRDVEAAQRFTAAADSYAAAELPLDHARARRWAALSWRWAGEQDRALAVLDEVDALGRTFTTGEPAEVWELGMLGYDGARVLIGSDRYDDALARLEGVAARFRSIEAFAEAVHVELLQGELLMRLERPVEAEPVLRGVLAAAPRDSSPHENAAWLLSEALEALGRVDEAEALRREYGFGQ